MKEFEIKTEFIKLDQFLKFAELVSSGGEAKELIAEGKVKVNGEEETRRGKKLRSGDEIEFAGESYRIK
ncbi:MAG: S4 domain-containing protein YaaA [Gallicola sp.]|nr:S4 domain-containing protein YaaA [Gallicola sp.]